MRPGTLFAALPGSTRHGADFIATALDAGRGGHPDRRRWARSSPPKRWPTADAALVVADDPREALAYAAALWFGAQPETMVAVTGTNGKTSVATFTRQIWAALGHAAINIGTTGVEGAWAAPSSHTTPGSDHPAPHAGRRPPPPASPMPRWRPLPTASTSAGLKACA